MAEGRSKLILVSVALAESIWLFGLFSVLGMIGDLGGSPLPWLSLLALMLISITTGYVLGATEGEEVAIAIRQSLLGLVVIYLLLGTGEFNGDRTFDAGWLFNLMSGELGSSSGVSALFGLVISVWLWRHGLRLGTDRYPEDRLARIFKIGIGVLAVATLVDQATDDDLGARLLLVPFFGATLVGLAVGRLPEGGVGRKTGEWARIIGLSVFSIMATGLLIGLLGGLYGNGGVRLLFAGWGLLVDGFLWLLRFPLTWITAALEWFFSLFIRDGEPRREELVPGQSGREILGVDPEQTVESGSQAVDSILHILQYPVMVLIVLVVFFMLAMAFRRISAKDEDDGEEERESLRGELETSGDMSRLLGSLVPSWMKRTAQQGWRSPSEPGFAEVFKLYFDSVRLGMKWGMEFHPHMTPTERMPLLEAALPGAPIRELTDSFNAACYGKIPADPDAVIALRQRMKLAEEQLRNR